ncbi:GTPase [Roseivirga sp. 4D4]|uniref:ATP-binding cassette domain-containing protein n=1 Tax=Roseivirga sp. 4D4 TaxID=1889784 RepID=UPI0008539EBA|nr:ATP-binding cassette domain-containing protein [Roseivirga sp. 4D4]OEK00779.1 GTPase [Roseivirga sp. 4D4]
MILLDLHKQLNANQGSMDLEVELDIAQGNFTAIQGKSGAGKTSLLRMIVGLMQPDKGVISVKNQPWFDSKEKVNLEIQKRGVGYVFQDYALFPNMTVKENLEFALPKGDSGSIIQNLVELMELGDLQSVKPETLSGGQKQRVALARALVQQPKLLLLDEPLSALDVEMRGRLQHHILMLHNEFNLTTLMVTHDDAEVLRLADTLIVMDSGKVIKHGKPAEILGGSTVTGKFQFTGEIIDIKAEGVVSIITVMVAKELVRVVSDVEEATSLSVGDKVLVASKAFNPIIRKLS